MDTFPFRSKVRDLSVKRINKDFNYLFIIAKFLGDIPFNSEFNYKWYLMLYTLATYTGLISAAVLCLTSPTEFKGFNKLLVIINYVQFNLIGFCGIVNIFCSLRLKKSLVKITQQLEYFDANLKRIGDVAHYDYSGCMYGAAFDLIFIVIDLILDLIYSDGIGEMPWLMSSVFYYGMFAKMFMYKRLITNMMYVFKVRFKKLKGLLNSESLTEKLGYINVEILCYQHHRLVEAANLLNIAFGPQIMAFISIFFMITVVLLYTLTSTVMALQVQNPRANVTPFTIVIMSWSVMAFYNVWHIIHAASVTSNEAEDFNKELHKAMVKDSTGNLSTNKLLLLHIGARRKVIFTAWSFYPLEYLLIHSMFAAAATYLVILVQFSPAAPSTDISV